MGLLNGDEKRMARLPQPGGDAGSWGAILNDYLGQAHNDDGTLKPIGAAGISAGAVTASAIADNTISEAKLDADLAAKVNAGGGTVNLAGDVTGPSTATVVGKVNGIAVSGTPAPGQVLTANDATTATWEDAGNVTLAGDVVGSNTSNTVVKVNGIAVSGTPTAGQVLTASDATTAAWADAGAGGAVTMAGDVTGTNSASVVSKINGITVSGTPTIGQVLKATSATEASWGTDEVGTGGSSSRTVVTKNANYTAVAGDYVLATGAITVTLPEITAGSLVSVKKLGSGTGTVTVVPTGSATIDGGANWTTNQQYVAQDFITDGANWFKL